MASKENAGGRFTRIRRETQHKGKMGQGVFISWMGFTDEGLTAFGKGKRVICVSGYDLYHSLSYGIALPDLLEAKLRHAAETGEPYAELDRLYPLKDKIPGTPKYPAGYYEKLL